MVRANQKRDCYLDWGNTVAKKSQGFHLLWYSGFLMSSKQTFGSDRSGTNSVDVCARQSVSTISSDSAYCCCCILEVSILRRLDFLNKERTSSLHKHRWKELEMRLFVETTPMKFERASDTRSPNRSPPPCTPAGLSRWTVTANAVRGCKCSMWLETESWRRGSFLLMLGPTMWAVLRRAVRVHCRLCVRKASHVFGLELIPKTRASANPWAQALSAALTNSRLLSPSLVDSNN